MYHLIRPALLLLATCLHYSAMAADSIDHEITIQADHMQLDLHNGNSMYTGNVRIEKGDIVLSGERVLINKKHDRTDSIQVLGKPARYSQKTADVDVSAQSEQMFFDLNTNILTMKDKARLQQQGQLIESDYIAFDTDKQALLAGKQDQAQPGQRVNIILTPEKQIE